MLNTGFNKNVDKIKECLDTRRWKILWKMLQQVGLLCSKKCCKVATQNSIQGMSLKVKKSSCGVIRTLALSYSTAASCIPLVCRHRQSRHPLIDQDLQSTIVTSWFRHKNRHYSLLEIWRRTLRWCWCCNLPGWECRTNINQLEKQAVWQLVLEHLPVANDAKRYRHCARCCNCDKDLHHWNKNKET